MGLYTRSWTHGRSLEPQPAGRIRVCGSSAPEAVSCGSVLRKHCEFDFKNSPSKVLFQVRSERAVWRYSKEVCGSTRGAEKSLAGFGEHSRKQKSFEGCVFVRPGFSRRGVFQTGFFQTGVFLTGGFLVEAVQAAVFQIFTQGFLLGWGFIRFFFLRCWF